MYKRNLCPCSSSTIPTNALRGHCAGKQDNNVNVWSKLTNLFQTYSIWGTCRVLREPGSAKRTGGQEPVYETIKAPCFRRDTGARTITASPCGSLIHPPLQQTHGRVIPALSHQRGIIIGMKYKTVISSDTCRSHGEVS